MSDQEVFQRTRDYLGESFDVRSLGVYVHASRGKEHFFIFPGEKIIRYCGKTSEDTIRSLRVAFGDYVFEKRHWHIKDLVPLKR